KEGNQRTEAGYQAPQNRRGQSKNPESQAQKAALRQSHGQAAVNICNQRIADAGKQAIELIRLEGNKRDNPRPHGFAITEKKEQREECNYRFSEKRNDSADDPRSPRKQKAANLFEPTKQSASHIESGKVDVLADPIGYAIHQLLGIRVPAA